MSAAADMILVVLVLTGLALLGSSRLAGGIRTAAAQGFLLALLPLFMHGEGGDGLAAWGLALGSAAIKGFLFPAWLLRAVRETDARREMEPFVGPTMSILAGLAVLGLAFWVSSRLPLPPAARATLAVPAGLFTVWTGLFLICARRKAVTQVLGFIILENGVFTLGVALVRGTPWLIELGVLLDVFVAVFVMGIIVFHISREFDHMDADRLAQLKDAPR
jgi:hydrogenase-4 component E